MSHTGTTSTTSTASASAATLSRTDRAEQTRVLLARAQQVDADAQADLLNEVVLLNRRIAQAVAARYRHKGVPDEDLEQAAYEGLVKAVSRFDPSLRHDLLSFAVPTIRGEIQRYFRDHAWMVRPPRRLQELQWQINRTTADLAGVLGREPSPDEVQVAVGIGTQEYGEALQSFGCFQPSSLDQPVRSAPELTLGDAVPDSGREQDEVETRVLLQPLLARLGERDRLVIQRRYFEDRSQQEIADELGVTQTQVSRVLSRILRDLHRQLAPEQGLVAADYLAMSA
ncbi:MAG: sigma-70 family RNA polymerase sigma factor [Nocardioides sp.]|nr:sigma-70 family RNA polymerase sigma factor [Nocardioides sp.]